MKAEAKTRTELVRKILNSPGSLIVSLTLAHERPKSTMLLNLRL